MCHQNKQDLLLTPVLCLPLPARREGTPQCFLLTPKLLPDLPFTRDVTVLQIMNGSHIKDVSARWPSWALPAVWVDADVGALCGLLGKVELFGSKLALTASSAPALLTFARRWLLASRWRGCWAAGAWACWRGHSLQI